MDQEFTVNGHTYRSWAEVPPELKEALSALPDADGDGVPDLFQGRLDGLVGPDGPGAPTTVTTTTDIEVDGQHYRSLDDVPAPVRDLLQRTLGAPSGAAAATDPDPQPGTATGSAPAPTPPPAGADQVVLNGQPVNLDQATTGPGPKGLLRRLFGR